MTADLPRQATTADGARIAYRVRRSEGARPVLVLVHGLASNLTRWSEFAARTALAPRWDLVRVDLRGNGESVRRGRIGMDEWCLDLVAVLDAEGYARAVIAGHCLGAHVALELATRRPERVAGLVLIEPTFGPALAGAMRRVARLRPLIVPALWLIRTLNAAGLHRRRMAPLDLEQLDRQTRASMAGGRSEAALARHASPWLDLRATPSAVYLAGLLAMGDPPPDLSTVGAPSLALVSAHSAFSDPAITAEILGRLARCEVVVLEARHWIPTERPDAMRRAIDDWCGHLCA